MVVGVFNSVTIFQQCRIFLPNHQDSDIPRLLCPCLLLSDFLYFLYFLRVLLASWGFQQCHNFSVKSPSLRYSTAALSLSAPVLSCLYFLYFLYFSFLKCGVIVFLTQSSIFLACSTIVGGSIATHSKVTSGKTGWMDWVSQ